LRTQYFGPQGELFRKQQELIKPIQDNIYDAVKDIATQQGYTMVADRASATSIIFASPSIDISDQILSRLGY
ncbi:MAG: OmpH family outer membrane protein, partial [Proteiniphilum sp.]